MKTKKEFKEWVGWANIDREGNLDLDRTLAPLLWRTRKEAYYSASGYTPVRVRLVKEGKK